MYQVIKGPHVTEKATMLKGKARQLCFEVDTRANKIEIRRAVEVLFKTRVVAVKTMNFFGKRRRVGRHTGKRADWKKALVTLAAGQDLEIIEGM